NNSARPWLTRVFTQPGSKAEMATSRGHVRFTAGSRHHGAGRHVRFVPKAANQNVRTGRDEDAFREGWPRPRSKLFFVMRPPSALSEACEHPLVLGATVKRGAQPGAGISLAGLN